MVYRRCQFLILAIGFCCGLAVLGSCKTRGFQTASIRRSDNPGALERWLKAQDSLVPVQETVLNPFNSKSLEGVDAYKQARADYNPRRSFESDPGVVDIRPELVSLSQTDGLRDLLESSVIVEQRRRSQLLKSKMNGGDPQFLRYDTVIIGAGPHAAALVQEFTDLDPRRRILVVDAASRPGGTFADVGPVFALNSTNREDTGGQANVGRGQSGGSKGDGNLNAVANLIGIPDFGGLKWPLAGDLGYVTTLAVEYSSADILLNTRVLAIGPFESGLMSLQLDGVSPKVAAGQVVLATGIGKPAFFLPNAENARRQLETPATQAGKPPPIMGFGEFVKRINADLRNNLNPMANYANKRILVVGAGDSGKVLIEWLAGLGPDSRSYGGAQIGAPKEIVWSGVDFLTCQQFLERARARYSPIAQALNSATVALAPLKVTSFRADQTKVVIDGFALRRDTDGNLLPPDLPQETQDEVEILERLGQFFTTKGIRVGELSESTKTTAKARFEIVTNRSDPTFDYLIDATGFRTETLALLQAGFGKSAFPDGSDLSAFFDARSKVINEGANEQLRGTNRRFVAQLKKPGSALEYLPVFLVGPANEQVAPLVDEDETSNVSANTVSLFANIIRTKQLPAELIKAYPAAVSAGLSPERFLRHRSNSASRPSLGIGQAPSISSEITLNLSGAAETEGSFKISPARQDLEIALRKVLSGFQISGDLENFKLFIFLDTRNGQSPTRIARTVTIKVTPGFKEERDRNVLEAAINGDAGFKDLLFKLFAPDRVARENRERPASFNGAQSVIFAIDNWGEGGQTGREAGTDPVVAIRVRSDVTQAELRREAGVVLQVSQAAAPQADPPMIQRVIESREKLLFCLPFRPVGDALDFIRYVYFDPFNRQQSRVLGLVLTTRELYAGQATRTLNAYVVRLDLGRNLIVGGLAAALDYVSTSPFTGDDLTPALDAIVPLGLKRYSLSLPFSGGDVGKELIVGPEAELLGLDSYSPMTPTILPTDQEGVLQLSTGNNNNSAVTLACALR